MKKKVVIIGAGPAGLTAGYELLKRSNKYQVIILEESNDIGGISKTINYKGNRMDIGGHRFFSKDKRVNEFWQSIMPIQGKPSFDDLKLKRVKQLNDNGPDPEKSDNVFLKRNRVSRIYYSKKFFDYPVSLKMSTIKNLGFIKTIQSGFSYLKSIFIKKKEDSLENFYINRFGKKLYSTFFEDYTEKVWGRHPSNISSDWGAQRVKGLSLIGVFKDSFLKLFKKANKNKETSLIEEYIYPKYGPGEFWEKVCSEIEKMGGKVLKNHKVIKINNEKNKIQSVICEINGKEKEIKADIFLSSMPLKDLVSDMSNVPRKVAKVAENLPYRDFITIGLLVKKLNLKNETNIKTLNNIVPDCWIYVQEPNVKLGRIQIFNNWSPYMVKEPLNNVWIGLEYFCNENDDFWNLNEKESIKFAISELVKLGIIDENDVIDSHREKIKKAYPAYFDSYNEIDKVINYLNKYDNLYCIGRNGQHRYNNMDHSMKTAMEATDNILNNKNSKMDIWNVNTEQEYHEESKNNSKIKKIKDKLKKVKINKWFLLIFMISIPLLWWAFSNWQIDNDSYFLFNHGRYVLENGLPTIEPFTMHENLKFIMQQWPFAIGYYLLYLKTGEVGIFIALILITYIITFALYKLCMLVSNKNYILSMIISFAIIMILLNSYVITTRPQIITYLLMILVIYIIEKYRKTGNYKVLLWMPLISILQINIHASMWWFIFIFTLPFLAEGIFDRIILKKKNIYDFRWLIIISLFNFLVGFLNPYGIDAIYYFINSYGGKAAEIINEMRPVRILSFSGLFIVGTIFTYFIIYIIRYAKYKEIKVSYIFMLFGCMILSFMAKKSFPFFGIFTIYPLSYFLQDMFRNNCLENPSLVPVKLINKFIVLIILSVVVLISVNKSKILIENHTDFYIKEGVDKLLEKYDTKDMKVYTNYDIGNYLEWYGIKAFIDSRAEVFYLTMNGKYDIFGDYYSIQENNGDIYKFIESYNFTHLFVVYYDRLYSYEQIEGYSLFYEKDKMYRIYVRDDLSKI